MQERKEMTHRNTALTKTMSFVEEKAYDTSSPRRSVKKRAPIWADIWLNNTTSSLKQSIFNMKASQSPTPASKDPDKVKTLTSSLSRIDRILLLSDDILLRILSKLPVSQRKANSLVCKRWLNLQGRLVRSLKVLDWYFLESGRLITRFPNLSNVDLINACFVRRIDAGVLLSRRLVTLQIGSCASMFCDDDMLLPVEIIDRGLKALGCGCPNLRRLVLIGASEMGLLSVAEECSTLQELELHKCSDNVLRGIAACENLQILKLVGNAEGFYSSLVSDIGLTILAQGCKRLVKLELSGCEGSFDGIKAIGQCCQMLEELTFCDHKMEGDWLAALSYFENLKTLRFVSCKRIDPSPGPDEYLGSCPALERLHLQKCQMREKKSMRGLFRVCGTVRELVIQDCWGLDNDIFNFASIFRRVEFLSLQGCSLLTTEGLESVILSWRELQNLRVVSCKNIKDGEVSPALSTLFSVLKELKWRPDTKSLLASSTAGTGIGKRGGKFFKKTLRLK